MKKTSMNYKIFDEGSQETTPPKGEAKGNNKLLNDSLSCPPVYHFPNFPSLWNKVIFAYQEKE